MVDYLSTSWTCDIGQDGKSVAAEPAIDADQ